MVQSMTAYASGTGGADAWAWSWELRSVNSRGLDLRLRVPEWIDGLEPGLRTRLRDAAARGAITVSLRLGRADEGRGEADSDAVEIALRRIATVHARAAQQGMTLAPSTATDVLTLAAGESRGHAGPEEIATLRNTLLAQFEAEILAPFLEMRQAEGRALGSILLQHVDDISRLVDTAAELAEARLPKMQAGLEAALSRVAGNAEGADPTRVAQELAMVAVRADVTEEIDRLRTHVVAARDHLADHGPIGRKLDFLAQEFNREANTLCAKAQDTDLGATGLALKAVIDQMREQIQNVE
ncbi:YicC/YloC family endoribonuclease [Palleronia sp. LCG004]|uniref:YicC/YloC family endoribonuclease n=1 Tax=Palleronia sp. LCG004 TaxID=3079304 RepID=UPI00294288DC|nr:YicC/YloC family endoribonuclease [Palleronia sp. LCG004]WOI57217.1 YicC/YloC family endoribonuclease [Palleronia sp. LCG004]